MVDVAVIGGCPAGWSAALFTAKNGLGTVVYDTDETWMYEAHLFNYLSVRSLAGEEFMTLARGQVSDMGAKVNVGEEVTGIDSSEGEFIVTTEEGEIDARYVVMATGADRELATELGCETTDDDTIAVNLDMETSVENAYATGAMVRPQKWQAVIAAGDGAAAALDILSKEKGEHLHDFDVPSDVPGR